MAREDNVCSACKGVFRKVKKMPPSSGSNRQYCRYDWNVVILENN